MLIYLLRQAQILLFTLQLFFLQVRAWKNLNKQVMLGYSRTLFYVWYSVTILNTLFCCVSLPHDFPLFFVQHWVALFSTIDFRQNIRHMLLTIYKLLVFVILVYLLLYNIHDSCPKWMGHIHTSVTLHLEDNTFLRFLLYTLS